MEAATGAGVAGARAGARKFEVKREKQFAVCISNKGCVASLEVRKIYRLIPDKVGSKHGLVRVVDEMGEDYLFPEEYFVPVNLPQAVECALLRATV